MATLTASANPTIVDNTVGDTQGSTTITYEKEPWEELWHRTNRDGWDRPNLHVLTGLGDVAERRASYPITLAPGDWYEVGIFDENDGPLTTDPGPLDDLVVFWLWKEPERRALISDTNQASGGTFRFSHVHTLVPTVVALVAASRLAPTIVDGLPVFDDDPRNGLIRSHSNTLGDDHRFELLPLVPGHLHHFAILVIDAGGNWEVLRTPSQPIAATSPWGSRRSRSTTTVTSTAPAPRSSRSRCTAKDHRSGPTCSRSSYCPTP
jgi:hypothetical protein